MPRQEPLPEPVKCQEPGCTLVVDWVQRGEPPTKCTKHRRFRGDPSKLVPLYRTRTPPSKSGPARATAAALPPDPFDRVIKARKLAAVRRVFKEWGDAARFLKLTEEGDALVEIIALAESPEFEGLRKGTHKAVAETVSVTTQLQSEKLFASAADPKAKPMNELGFQLMVKTSRELGGLDPVPPRIRMVYRIVGKK